MTRIDKTRGSCPFWYIRAIAQVEQFGEKIREARRWFEHGIWMDNAFNGQRMLKTEKEGRNDH